MGFLEAYKSFWRNYVNFSGRAPRSAYWYVVLWNVIIFVILYALAFIFGISAIMEAAMGGTGMAGGGGNRSGNHFMAILASGFTSNNQLNGSTLT